MKKILREALASITKNIDVRGRHRAAQIVGNWLKPNGVETIHINGMDFPIDHTIMLQRLVYYGLYEEDFIKHLQKTLKEGDVFIDPGTNIGYISAVVSGLVGPSGQVFSIEPSKKCFNQIKTYLPKSTNQNIRLFHAALSDKVGKAQFCETDFIFDFGYSYLLEAEGDQPSRDTYQIDTLTIDSLCQKHQIEHVKYLKLDVEGSEFMAIQGAKTMLEAKKIEYVLVETTFYDKYEAINQKIADALTNFGYMPFQMKANGDLKPIKNIQNIKNNRFDVIWKVQTDTQN